MGSLFKDAFVRPQEIGRAKELSKKKTFLYLVLLSLIMLIPMSFQVVNVLQNLHTDGAEIAEKIPDFSIENDTLSVPEKMKSYIHHTDTFTFFFDPNGEISEKEVDDSIANTTSMIGVALLKNELYFNASLYTFSTPYDQIRTFTADQIREPFRTIGNLGGLSSILFGFIFWFIVFINLLIELLIYTLFANIFSSLMGIRQKFGQTWKIVMVASTLPITFFALLDFVGVTPIFELEAKGIAIMVLFLLAMKPLIPSNRKKGS